MLRRFNNNFVVSSSTSRRIVSPLLSLSLTQQQQRLQSSNNTTSNNNNNKESEVEREARMRQEMMNKLTGGRNPFSGMFGGGQNNNNNNTGGNNNQQGGFGGFDTSNYNHWANTPLHRSLRFWASVTIFITGIYLMRRMGLMGDYSHLTVPFYAASPADQTKWILFIFNVEDARRRQLVQQWETTGVKNQYLSFFDFVDSQEQFWRSSPNYSGEQVITTVASAMRNQGAPRAITSIKAVLNTSSFFSSTIFGGTGNPVEQRAGRIDSMMANLGTGGPSPSMASMFGLAGMRPPQQQQQVAPGSPSSPVVQGQGGLYAMPTGFVSPTQQQQYGGMNHYQLMNQQQQQQQRGFFSGAGGAPQQQQYFMGSTNPYGQVPIGYGGAAATTSTTQQLPLQQQFGGFSSNNNIVQSTTSSEEKKDGPHSCEVHFVNDQQQQQQEQRPDGVPVGTAEMKNQ